MMIFSSSTLSRVIGLNITMRDMMALDILEEEGTSGHRGSLSWTGVINLKLNRNISTSC